MLDTDRNTCSKSFNKFLNVDYFPGAFVDHSDVILPRRRTVHRVGVRMSPMPLGHATIDFVGVVVAAQCEMRKPLGIRGAPRRILRLQRPVGLDGRHVSPQFAGVGKVGYVDNRRMRTDRLKLIDVGRAEVDRNGAALQRVPELLVDIVVTQTVLQNQIKLVMPLQLLLGRTPVVGTTRGIVLFKKM